MAINPTRQARPVATHDLETQLRETIQRYELIFKATNDVLYDLDLISGSLVWNEALYTQYGYPRDEKADTLEWWTEHIHPNDALPLEAEVDARLNSQENTWQAEYRFRKADGSYVYVRDRAVIHRDIDGTPLRITGLLLDITKQKQLARAKDEFISLISHQLRTPLSAIRLYGEMLTNGTFGQLTPEQTEPIKHIADSSVRLIKLVDTILNISKIELGHIASTPVLTNVNELIHEYINEVTPLALEKHVSIIFKPKKKIKKVLIDTTILGQVLHNLLTNAIRYTKPHEGTVTVSFDKNTDGYLLAVSDNGIGISETAQLNIFHRFYRAENTTNLKEHGSGLGLYLIKLMTESTGCKVWFESVENKGTTFYVRIPESGMKAQ